MSSKVIYGRTLERPRFPKHFRTGEIQAGELALSALCSVHLGCLGCQRVAKLERRWPIFCAQEFAVACDASADSAERRLSCWVDDDRVRVIRENCAVTERGRDGTEEANFVHTRCHGALAVMALVATQVVKRGLRIDNPFGCTGCKFHEDLGSVDITHLHDVGYEVVSGIAFEILADFDVIDKVGRLRAQGERRPEP